MLSVFCCSSLGCFAAGHFVARRREKSDKRPEAQPPAIVRGKAPQLVTSSSPPRPVPSRPWCCGRRRVDDAPCQPVPAPGADAARAVWRDVRAQFPDGAAEWVQLSDAQRLLVATEGDLELARRKLTSCVNWRKRTLEPWQAEDDPVPMEQRLIGFSKLGNPVLYGCAVHQQSFEVPPRHLAVVFDKTLQELPPSTKLDVIMDSHGFQLFLNLNPKPWLKLAPAFDAYFAERFHTIYAIDMPASATFIWKLVEGVLPPKTKKKFHFLSSRNPADMERLYNGVCDGPDMREMLEQILRMNRTSTPRTGRSASHALTESFLVKQRQRRQLQGTDTSATH